MLLRLLLALLTIAGNGSRVADQQLLRSSWVPLASFAGGRGGRHITAPEGLLGDHNVIYIYTSSGGAECTHTSSPSEFRPTLGVKKFQIFRIYDSFCAVHA